MQYAIIFLIIVTVLIISFVVKPTVKNYSKIKIKFIEWAKKEFGQDNYNYELENEKITFNTPKQIIKFNFNELSGSLRELDTNFMYKIIYNDNKFWILKDN